MGLAEGMTAGNQCDCLFVVHRHAFERLTDVARRRHRVRIAVGAFRVDVDQTHLNGAERVGQLAVAAVTLILEPHSFRAPVDVFLRCPDVGATATETERLEAHRLDGAVAGEDQQVCPRDLAAVLLLHRPQEPAGLVEADVVGPAVERREALCARSTAAATVQGAVRAGRVPCHADEERPVVSVVSRPPVLRVGHQRVDVGGQSIEVDAVELCGVVEVLPHRIGLGMVLAKHPEVQAVGPPVVVGRDSDSQLLGIHHRAGRRGRLVAGGHRSVFFVAHVLAPRLTVGIACVSD